MFTEQTRDEQTSRAYLVEIRIAPIARQEKILIIITDHFDQKIELRKENNSPK